MPEATFDPADWDAFRSLAHRMVDDTVDHLASLRELPAWQEAPAEVRRRILDEPVPRHPQGDDAAYQGFLRDVRPYPSGNLHPRFFGWVQGGGTPLAAMADMLASALDPHLAGFNQAPALVERKVVAWLAELMGFPPTASGVLESGGTMASVLALAIARQAKAGYDVRREGLQSGGRVLTVYGSTETHGWLTKGVEFLGFGTDAMRLLPVDREFRIDVGALRAAIDADVAAGHRPVCVIGTAGTVGTGATDDLHALAVLCAERDIWFHVDGAFGALARLSPRLAPLVDGIERADSLTFDLHKWMYLPFEIACLLVRDEAAHTGTFAHAPSYIAGLDRGVIAGGLEFSDRGMDLTRSFKALKAWMCMKSYGIDAFAALIEQNVDQTRYLVERAEASPHLELVAPAPMNVACFRFVAPGLSESELDAINLEILFRIQEKGIATPSSATIDGKFAIRACNVNHRARQEDIHAMVDGVIGEGLAQVSS